MLEQLIRELVASCSNPVHYKINQIETAQKCLAQDHSVYAHKMSEYDKRLHQVVEYVREKCDD